jgi:glycosyltransferase involved in cell wall biosynthesis
MGSGKLLIATDAWRPQVNGVVRTLEATAYQMDLWGYKVEYLEPSMFKSFPCPNYPEIRLALPAACAVKSMIKSMDPDFIHISTEGPIGMAVRNYCVRRKIPFTTSYHTQFPLYLKKIAKVPEWMSWMFLRWFHGKSRAVLTPSLDMKSDLEAHGFKNVIHWTRGVDEEFTPQEENPYAPCNFPIFLYVGRVSKEKNIEAFLELADKMAPAMFWIVGDGPHRKELEEKYASDYVHFVGYKKGAELAAYYTHADVFVFPSKTDTFGLVNIEALACGTPVAAYPSTGPKDILGQVGGNNPKLGCMDEDLETAMKQAFLHSGHTSACTDFVREHYSWEAATEQFEQALVKI